MKKDKFKMGDPVVVNGRWYFSIWDAFRAIHVNGPSRGTIIQKLRETGNAQHHTFKFEVIRGMEDGEDE